MQNFESIDTITKIKVVCTRIYQNQKDVNSIRQLEDLLKAASPTTVKTLEPIIFSVFFPILKNISESETSFKEKEKQLVIDTFKVLFERITLTTLPIFFNIYGFLLFEIYDHKNHAILDISEEYKLSIVECMTSLARSLSPAAVEALYVKDNAPKLCQMIYAVLEVAKNEQLKTLRISAINCIMEMARVLGDDDFNDLVIRNQVADVFLFFLPGVASQLKSIALIDEKYGHKIPCTALKAWGRIVTLLMQDYNASDQKINLKEEMLTPYLAETTNIQKKWETDKELKEYINQTERSPKWYRDTDKKLQPLVVELSKLTHHSHPKIRLELANTTSLVIENCVQTMPSSVSHLIGTVIILSEDSDSTVSSKSRSVLETLSTQLTTNEFKSVMDNIEEGFYGTVTSIPRKFNAVDERIQIVALNSLIGYIRLFGKYSLTRVLYSSVHLNRLVLTLIHISEFDKSGVSVLEEYSTPGYELGEDSRTSWKKFRHFKEEPILQKIEIVCRLLAKFGASAIITDFLLDIIASDSDQKREAIFLLNEVVMGIETHDDQFTILKNIIQTYTDNNNWYLPLSVMIDDEGYEHTLSDVQGYIIQTCLLVEGIGKIALSIKQSFQQFMLKTLYLVLERAGSAHPVVRVAGAKALSAISTAGGYSDITDLINANIDYFSFHIGRKLLRGTGNVGGLNVLSVVIRYSTKQVLYSTCEVVRELLIHTYDKQKAYHLNAYLQVFKMFIHGLHRWLNIIPIDEPWKTKQQKLEEVEDFKVSSVDTINDFSDDIMGKTAEELYKEDMAKKREEVTNEVYDEPTEYKKPDSPTHVNLTVAILSRSLHYLPSKDQQRKLLVLDILMNGLPVLKEWEDELLPMVHQIWSPLVDRFKEINDPLVVNYSFKLLVVLAKLSKDFIRSRTSKEALPNILAALDKLSQQSYLKDRGAAYRYSQNYKLQETILDKLAEIVTDLDMQEADFDKCANTLFRYLSDKQPLPLQRSALEFFVTLAQYDPPVVEKQIRTMSRQNVADEFKKNIAKIESLVCSDK